MIHVCIRDRLVTKPEFDERNLIDFRFRIKIYELAYQRDSNMEDSEPSRSFEIEGSSDELVCLLGGMDLDEHLNIYITDFGNKKIRVYTFYGQYITTLFHGGTINSPFSIAIDNISMRVAVTNLGRGYVVMLRGNGSGPSIVTSEPQLLSWPSGLTIDENGDTFVADCNNNRVAIFDDNLIFQRALLSKTLFRPRDVKVYRNKVYVSSSKPYHVHVFSKTGELLSSIIYLDAEGNLFLVVSPRNGNIILSNSNRSEILIYSPGGELIKRCALSRPTGIVLTPAGDFIVASHFCATVNIFRFD